MARIVQLLLATVVAIGISKVECAIKYPANIETKGGGHSGRALVDLKYAENEALAYFDYEATFVMGSTAKITIRGSTRDGDKVIQNEQVPGEDFFRVIQQRVVRSSDANGLQITVYLDSTLKLAGVKEKYGKSSIGVRVVSKPRSSHFWDIKHEYSNNYEGEDKGEVCLGCDEPEEEKIIEPVVQKVAYEPSLPYTYAYNVNDAPTNSLYNHDVKSDGNMVKGEYKVLMSDGRTQVVTYTADWINGFVPVIKYV